MNEAESDSLSLPAAPPARPLSSGSAIELDACWNTRGVYGNSQCETLRELVHCRHCPDYSQAGLQLLDRSLSPEYRREWTEHFAQSRRLVAPGKTPVVIFRVRSEWLALPAEVLQEVAERRRIHSLPHRRHSIVLGLINIRGELLVCLSVGRLLRLEDRPREGAATAAFDRLLVAIWHGHRFVLPVDEVHGVDRLYPPEVQAPPMTVARSNPTYTRGVFMWRRTPVGLLDANLLFPALNRSMS